MLTLLLTTSESFPITADSLDKMTASRNQKEGLEVDSLPESHFCPLVFRIIGRTKVQCCRIEFSLHHQLITAFLDPVISDAIAVYEVTHTNGTAHFKAIDT